MLFNHLVAGHAGSVRADGSLVSIVGCIFGQGLHRNGGVILHSGVQNGGFEHLAQIFFLGAKAQQFRESPIRDDLAGFLALVLFQQGFGGMQVAALLLKMLLPDLFNMQVGFILHAGPIKVALGIFMQQQVFQPSHAGVQQSAVLGHMLFFDHADLLVQPAAKVTVIKGADVHIIVHRLLFGGGDNGGVQLGDGGRRGRADGLAHAVPRVAVLRNGGAAGHDLGIAAHQPLGVDAAFQFQQIRIAVQVVKILQQSQVHHLHHIGVRLPLGQNSRQVHGQLLVPDGGFQNTFVDRL